MLNKVRNQTNMFSVNSFLNTSLNITDNILPAVDTLQHKAEFRRRTSHKPTRMKMRKNKEFCSIAFDSTHVRYGV